MSTVQQGYRDRIAYTESVSGEVIASALWSITPSSGVTLSGQVDTDASSKIFVSGLTSGVTYALLAALTCESGQVLHRLTTIQAVEETPEILPNVNFDLTTLARVKKYTGITSANEDDQIQLCITAASLEWLWATGRVESGILPATSLFISQQTYIETYDGNGNDMLALRQWPIRGVNYLRINGADVPPSLNYGVSGYRIDDSKKFLVLRSTSATSLPSAHALSLGYRFWAGRGNVEVSYPAGFDITPIDIVRACTQMVAVNYKRAQWIDMASLNLSTQGGSGSTRYRDWAIPPEVMRVMNFYTRKSYT